MNSAAFFFLHTRRSSRILAVMKWSRPLLLIVLPLALLGGTPGVFRGELVGAPKGEQKAGWIYVVSRRAMVRHVNVEHAQVLYADEVPDAKRLKDASRALLPGAEVMVTAEQDESGAWRASEVEILVPSARQGEREKTRAAGDHDRI